MKNGMPPMWFRVLYGVFIILVAVMVTGCQPLPGGHTWGDDWLRDADGEIVMPPSYTNVPKCRTNYSQ